MKMIILVGFYPFPPQLTVTHFLQAGLRHASSLSRKAEAQRRKALLSSFLHLGVQWESHTWEKLRNFPNVPSVLRRKHTRACL